MRDAVEVVNPFIGFSSPHVLVGLWSVAAVVFRFPGGSVRNRAFAACLWLWPVVAWTRLRTGAMFGADCRFRLRFWLSLRRRRGPPIPDIG